MKIYVFCDMEGVSGISGSDFVKLDGRNYALGRKYMTDDINACVRGCFEAGAGEVVVRDGHGCGSHVLWDQLDPRAWLYQGQNSTSHRRFPCIDGSAAIILLGYHAMAGTRGGLLEHTYSSATIQNIWLNGRRVGEIGLDSGIAADLGIPTIMVSGDDYACAEAREWIPGVFTCEVKRGGGCEGALLMPRDAAHKEIERTAERAVRALGDISPVELKRPVTVRIEKVERGDIPRDGDHGARVIDGRTYERTADTVLEAWFG